MQMSYLEFLKRSLIIVAVAVVPFLIWYLFGGRVGSWRGPGFE